MKSVLKLEIIAFVIACIASCQKGIESTQDDPVIVPIITLHDSVTRLAKFFYIDYRVSATDTMGYVDYTYDSLQRVTNIKSYSTNAGSAVLDEVYTYFYTGTDSMANKMTDEEKELVAPFTEAHFYSYDNLQRLTKDSGSYSSGEKEVIQLTYSATTIIGLRSFTDPADPYRNTMYKDTSFIGSTGDVIETNTLIETSDPDPAFVDYFTTMFTYDNKPNPFYQLNIRSTYNPVPGFDFFPEVFYLQKNNAVSSIQEYPSIPGSTETSTYTYTYNALGLPASVDVAYSFGQVDDYRLVFLYKKI